MYFKILLYTQNYDICSIKSKLKISDKYKECPIK